MTRIILSLTDHDAVLRRAELDVRVHAAYDAAERMHPEAQAGAYDGASVLMSDWTSMPTTVQATCVRCGRDHDALWTITRRTYDSGLYWPFVHINGARVLLDASLPTTVDKLPRDAVAVDPDIAAGWWHDDNESHVFGGPNVARALRESIAAHNASAGR